MGPAFRYNSAAPKVNCSSVLNFLLLCGLVFALPALAVEFEYENRNPANGAPYSKPNFRTLIIEGKFKKGDAARFVEFIRHDPRQYLRVGNVLIASSGGDLAEAVSIADIFKNTYKTVTVADWFGPCISACFYIVAAAVHRDISDGRIGLHRPYLPADAPAPVFLDTILG